MKLRDYLINEVTQSQEGKKEEEKYRKSQLKLSISNFYDMYAENPEKEMMRELELSVDDTIKRLKTKGMFK